MVPTSTHQELLDMWSLATNLLEPTKMVVASQPTLIKHTYKEFLKVLRLWRFIAKWAIGNGFMSYGRASNNL